MIRKTTKGNTYIILLLCICMLAVSVMPKDAPGCCSFFKKNGQQSSTLSSLYHNFGTEDAVLSKITPLRSLAAAGITNRKLNGRASCYIRLMLAVTAILLGFICIIRLRYICRKLDELISNVILVISYIHDSDGLKGSSYLIRA